MNDFNETGTDDDSGIRYGPPETLAKFIERLHRQAGDNTRIFICEQDGDGGRMLMLLIPLPKEFR